MNTRLSREAEQLTRQLSDKVLQSAHDAVESTRDYAHHALDSADGALRRARGRIDPAVEEFSSSAQRLAQRGLGLASETGARAQKQLQHCAAVTVRYVAEQPMRAILIAAAAGAVIAVLALSARKRRDTTHRHH